MAPFHLGDMAPPTTSSTSSITTRGSFSSYIKESLWHNHRICSVQVLCEEWPLVKRPIYDYKADLGHSSGLLVSLSYLSTPWIDSNRTLWEFFIHVDTTRSNYSPINCCTWSGTSSILKTRAFSKGSSRLSAHSSILHIILDRVPRVTGSSLQ